MPGPCHYDYRWGRRKGIIAESRVQGAVKYLADYGFDMNDGSIVVYALFHRAAYNPFLPISASFALRLPFTSFSFFFSTPEFAPRFCLISSIEIVA